MKTNIIRIGIGALSGGMLALSVMGLTGCSESGEKFTIERKTVDGLPMVIATNTAESQAKVDAIDYDDRSIALTGPKGDSEIFTVSKDVRNFAQIKKGDTVNVSYADRMIASVRKVSEEPSMQETVGVDTAPLGAKPGITAFRKVEMQTTVVSIDYAARTITLKGTSDKPMTLNVSSKLKDFDKIQKGDQVVFDYTEVISISVAK